LAKAAVKRLFAEERTMRPEGTRSSSYELFLVGLGKKIVGAPKADAAGGGARDAKAKDR
jgi:hypothetical protein